MFGPHQTGGRTGEAGTHPSRRAPLAGAIYGQMLATSTVAALTADDSLGAKEDVLALIGTILIFWLAHAYADFIATAAVETRVVSVVEIRRIMVDQWPIAQSAFPAVIPLALAAVGVWSDDTGATFAIASGVLALAGWGAIVARRTGRSPLATWAIALLNAALGLAMVGLLALVH